MNKTQVVKVVKNVSIIGSFAFVIHTLGRTETKRQEAVRQANTWSAMFGSLSAFAGEEVVQAWEYEIGRETPKEGDVVLDTAPVAEEPEVVEEEDHGTFEVDIPIQPADKDVIVDMSKESSGDGSASEQS